MIKKMVIDKIILWILVLGSVIFVLRSFNQEVNYFFALSLGVGFVYLAIDGFVRKEVIWSKGHVKFKEKPKDFILIMLFYSVVAIITIYNSLKLILLKI